MGECKIFEYSIDCYAKIRNRKSFAFIVIVHLHVCVSLIAQTVIPSNFVSSTSVSKSPIKSIIKIMEMLGKRMSVHGNAAR